MKIKILAIMNHDSKLVNFQCDAGDAVGQWRSSKLRPVVGQQYEAELDTSVVLRDDAIILTPNQSLKNHLKRFDPKTRLIATVERVDDDGMAYLRLAIDCLLMIESQGSLVRPGVMVSLSLEPTELQISPIG